MTMRRPTLVQTPLGPWQFGKRSGQSEWPSRKGPKGDRRRSQRGRLGRATAASLRFSRAAFFFLRSCRQRLTGLEPRPIALDPSETWIERKSWCVRNEIADRLLVVHARSARSSAWSTRSRRRCLPDRSYSRSSTGTPCPCPNPQVGANQGALVIPIRKGLEKVDVERSIFIVNHKGIVAAEVGPQVGSATWVR